MAKKKTSKKAKPKAKRADVETRFSKRHLTNLGRQGMNTQERAALDMSPMIYKRYLLQILNMPVSELRELANRENEEVKDTVFFQMLVKTTYATLQSRDIYRVDYFMSRLIGRIPEIAQSEKPGKYDNLTLEELETEYQKLIEDNKETLKHFENSEWFKKKEMLMIDVTPKKPTEGEVIVESDVKPSEGESP